MTWICSLRVFSFKMDRLPSPSPPLDPTDVGEFTLRRNKVPRTSKERREHLKRVREYDAMVLEDQRAKCIRFAVVQREQQAMAAEDEPWLERQIE